LSNVEINEPEIWNVTFDSTLNRMFRFEFQIHYIRSGGLSYIKMCGHQWSGSKRYETRHSKNL